MFDLPDLSYAYDALEPFIDVETMMVHYKKHHKGYTMKLNDALKELKSTETSIENILKNISKYPASVRNNGGGYYNHCLFWTIMAPKSNGGGNKPSSSFLNLLEKKFGSYDKFKELFAKEAATRFGSGWAWLCVDKDNKLFICSTPNQDNPLMDIAENKGKKGMPILGLDVWEHAYYLKYQNKRPDYIEAFWNVINWKEVERRYNVALKK
ncbi:MAG: superoxide dismutase [Bacteroidetes bacterium]|nr:superoxide dismutase [Bacteroidota bacterium]